ncbi:DUF4124 domain-containing protein [Aquabacterium sp.]|uniref:DUF4124 domain-containing protein n=1 Tax=Aquabacterium sp. TaxID=1872578 RepID=UPI004037F92B
MKKVRAPSSVLLALLMAGLVVVGSSAQAGMQWKWRDASGAIQYSDRPPPAGTPDKDILTRPTAAVRAAAKAAEAASAASAAATPVAPAASKADPELEARRKKADEEKAAKQKAEEEKIAQQKADNCQRARSYQRTLADGIRIVRTNQKGEREFLDDKARAEETQRNQEAISANCGK